MFKWELINYSNIQWKAIVPLLTCHIAPTEWTIKEILVHVIFWDPLIRAAVLGQLGRQAQANEARDELLTLVPDFSDRGRGLIQRIVYLDENVELLLDGLRNAGLKIVQDNTG